MQAQNFMGFNFHNPLVFPESPVPLEFTPFLGILVGVVLTLVLVAFVVILILRIKYQQSHHNRHPSGCLTTSIVLFPKNRIENIFWQEKPLIMFPPSGHWIALTDIAKQWLPDPPKIQMLASSLVCRLCKNNQELVELVTIPDIPPIQATRGDRAYLEAHQCRLAWMNQVAWMTATFLTVSLEVFYFFKLRGFNWHVFKRCYRW